MLLHTRELPWWKKQQKKMGVRVRVVQTAGRGCRQGEGEMEGRRYADESHGDGQSQGSCAPSAIGSRNAVCHGSRLVLA